MTAKKSDIDLDSFVRNLIKGGGIVFFGLFLELAISFIAKLIVARFLGPVNFGVISIGITTLTIFSAISLLGLNNGIGRYLPRYNDIEHRRGVILSSFQISIPISIIISFLILFFAESIATIFFKEPTATPILRIFAIMIPFATLIKLSIGTIQGLQKSIPKVIIRNITQPITRFSLIAIAIIIGGGLINIAWAYALSYFFTALLGAIYIIRKTPIFSVDIQHIKMHKEILTFSLPLLIMTTMTLVFSDIDTYMLAYFSSTKDVGIYNVIYPIANLLTMGLSAFGFLFMPILSELHTKTNYKEMRNIYQFVTKWIFMTTLPIFLIIGLFPEKTISITFGQEYIEGSIALSILSFTFFTHAIAGPNYQSLTSIGYTKLVMYDNILVAISNIMLNLFLIPKFSFVGAALATSLSYILLNILYSYQLYSKTKIHPLSRALILPTIISILLISFIYLIVKTFFIITIPLLIITLILFLIIYFVSIIRFGGIEDKDIMLILSFEEKFGINLYIVKKIVKKIMK